MNFPKDHWLHNAKIGDLHKKLGVDKNVKIPTKVLLKAARNTDPVPEAGGEATSSLDAIKKSIGK